MTLIITTTVIIIMIILRIVTTMIMMNFYEFDFFWFKFILRNITLSIPGIEIQTNSNTKLLPGTCLQCVVCLTYPRLDPFCASIAWVLIILKEQLSRITAYIVCAYLFISVSVCRQQCYVMINNDFITLNYSVKVQYYSVLRWRIYTDNEAAFFFISLHGVWNKYSVNW